MVKIGDKEAALRAMRAAREKGVVGDRRSTATATAGDKASASGQKGQRLEPDLGNTDAGGARSLVDAVMEAKGHADVRSRVGSPDVITPEITKAVEAFQRRRVYMKGYMKEWRKRKRDGT